MNPRSVVTRGVIGIISISALTAAIWVARSPSPEFTGPVEKVTIGASPSPVSSLIFVARDKGFFTQHGLEAQAAPPNFLGAIYVDALKAVKPERIRIH
jgi:ABC-type nitrate/sulfonate/bicarbonate transport system substrate-binding protein